MLYEVITDAFQPCAMFRRHLLGDQVDQGEVRIGLRAEAAGVDHLQQPEPEIDAARVEQRLQHPGLVGVVIEVIAVSFIV